MTKRRMQKIILRKLKDNSYDINKRPELFQRAFHVEGTFGTMADRRRAARLFQALKHSHVRERYIKYTDKVRNAY